MIRKIKELKKMISDIEEEYKKTIRPLRTELRAAEIFDDLKYERSGAVAYETSAKKEKEFEPMTEVAELLREKGVSYEMKIIDIHRSETYGMDYNPTCWTEYKARHIFRRPVEED